MRCEARITKEYKTKLADSIWPESMYGTNKDIDKYPEVCGGIVQVKVTAVDEPYHGGHSAKLEMEWICSRCNAPWTPLRLEMEQRLLALGGFDITDLLDALAEKRRGI